MLFHSVFVCVMLVDREPLIKTQLKVERGSVTFASIPLISSHPEDQSNREKMRRTSEDLGETSFMARKKQLFCHKYQHLSSWSTSSFICYFIVYFISQKKKVKWTGTDVHGDLVIWSFPGPAPFLYEKKSGDRWPGTENMVEPKTAGLLLFSRMIWTKHVDFLTHSSYVAACRVWTSKILQCCDWQFQAIKGALWGLAWF